MNVRAVAVLRKALMLVATSVLSLILVISGSFSWFTSKDELVNDFNIANYGVKLNEVFDEWNQKEVWASNTNDITALVRISSVPILKDKDGNRLDTSEIVEILRPADFDDNWYDGLDGWYYYKKALLPGEETTLFMEKVKISDDFDFSQNPEYADAELDVEVIMGSAPATNTYAHEEVWDISQNPQLKAFLRSICDSL